MKPNLDHLYTNRKSKAPHHPLDREFHQFNRKFHCSSVLTLPIIVGGPLAMQTQRRFQRLNRRIIARFVVVQATPEILLKVPLKSVRLSCFANHVLNIQFKINIKY
ncbi:hypothetical protein OUZ56_020878 [Daphnia magna]|uniref:Uncharacterized protein n=1 Tax=Daphnia magna TaxID=35525 RepID=A0ABQ9ZFV7_9CRUS|nr:hypothetical protein OUZ56_020878 [Daphnia magna]